MKPQPLFHTMILILASVFLLDPPPASAQEVVVWRETFEGDAPDWDPDRGVWEIGVPSNPSGPKAAYEGKRCASVGLRGNYPPNTSSSLVRHKKFVVPPASQNPRLRFWHWFSIDAGGDCRQHYDYAAVYAILDDGSQAQISPEYYWNSDWTRASLPLSQFAGKSVRLAFYFYSNCATEAGGWFIDDVQFITGEESFSGFESFECGLGGWAASRGNWQVGTPTNGPVKAFHGRQCAAVVLDGGYPANVSSELVSPKFVVPPTNQAPRLKFWHTFSIDAGGDCRQHWDYGQVFVRLSDGTTEPISPDYYWWSDWAPASLSLEKYAGQTIQVSFYFYSNCATGGTGWFIDDVELKVGPERMPALEGFENGWGDWSASRGNWTIVTPSNHLAYHTNCAALTLKGTYLPYVSSSLVSPPFVVSADASSEPGLRFWHSYAINAGGDCRQHYDYGQVYVVLSNGTSEAISAEYYNSSDWTRVFLPLGKYVGQTIRVAFSFNSNCATEDAGWFIDDVEVLPAVRNKAPALQPIPTQIASAGAQLSFTAKAKDPDSKQIVAYSLDADTAPTGASIDPITGLFTWTPTAEQCRTNAYYISVRATDNGTPALSAWMWVPIAVDQGVKLLYTQKWERFKVMAVGGTPGINYFIEASDDLSKWDRVKGFSLLARGEAVCYPDDGARPASQWKFFRVRGTVADPVP